MGPTPADLAADAPLAVCNISEDDAFDASFEAEEKVSREAVSETFPKDVANSYPETPEGWS